MKVWILKQDNPTTVLVKLVEPDYKGLYKELDLTTDWRPEGYENPYLWSENMIYALGYKQALSDLIKVIGESK